MWVLLTSGFDLRFDSFMRSPRKPFGFGIPHRKNLHPLSAL